MLISPKSDRQRHHRLVDPLAATESNPFARSTRVTFSGSPWRQDISHGEMIRAGVDQTMEIDSCRMQYLCQGLDPGAGGDYNKLPWRLGLLTQDQLHLLKEVASMHRHTTRWLRALVTVVRPGSA